MALSDAFIWVISWRHGNESENRNFPAFKNAPTLYAPFRPGTNVCEFIWSLQWLYLRLKRGLRKPQTIRFGLYYLLLRTRYVSLQFECVGPLKWLNASEWNVQFATRVAESTRNQTFCNISWRILRSFIEYIFRRKKTGGEQRDISPPFLASAIEGFTVHARHANRAEAAGKKRIDEKPIVYPDKRATLHAYVPPMRWNIMQRESFAAD